jgi:DNA-binding NarL/FixJ family response regulator
MGELQKVLIADDEPEFAVALQMTLEAKSYQVMTASGRAEAQEMARSGEPDAVVLGTMTPRGEAFKLQQWFKQSPRFKDLPILVVDAPLEKRLIKGWRREEGITMEAEDYVSKPIEPALLVPRIQRLLDKTTRRIKILVADDHAVVRDGIRAVLSLQRDLEVVGEAINGKEAVEKVLVLLPDVVVMDIVMPVMSGLEATKHICQQCPQAKVLILTQYDDKENILGTEQAGAYGFIPKRAASSMLVAGIRSVYEGKRFTEPLTAELLAESKRQSKN